MDLATILANLGFSAPPAYIALAMAVCGILSTLLKAPASNANIFYTLFYRIVNATAANVGRAKNADDVAQSLSKDATKPPAN